jgi:hypothetical protein
MRTMFFICTLVCMVFVTRSQSFETERLILDIQKLSELKNILNDLYKGYQILENGYRAIRDISEGNFNLHKAFLDGLLLVSPAVKNYARVADIIAFQASIIRQSGTAAARYSREGHFSPDELLYIGAVFRNLLSESLQDLNQLLDILTDSKLRMSDAERLQGIDRVYLSAQNKYLFLTQFNNNTSLLGMQRAAEQGEGGTLRNLYGLP